MSTIRQPWSLVLAGGDGSRLRRLTTDRQGVSIPKQYCSLNGGPSLLRLAFERAARVSPWSRIATVVAEQHQQWWHLECDDLPTHNVVVQPENRGTAPGVLLPLLTVLANDPDPTIVVFPSDHFIADEDVLGQAVRNALEEVGRHPDEMVLLGMTPDDIDSEFGWIVPVRGVEGVANSVERFVEKPPPLIAAELLERGGLWNSFIFAARARVLIELYARKLPLLLAALETTLEQDRLAGNGWSRTSLVYQGLDSSDFCRDLLQGEEQRLRTLAVGPCGWSDLGTPDRVARCVERGISSAMLRRFPVKAPMMLAGRVDASSRAVRRPAPA